MSLGASEHYGLFSGDILGRRGGLFRDRRSLSSTYAKVPPTRPHLTAHHVKTNTFTQKAAGFERTQRQLTTHHQRGLHSSWSRSSHFGPIWFKHPWVRPTTTNSVDLNTTHSPGPDPLDQGPLQIWTTKLRGPGPGSQFFSSDSAEQSTVMWVCGPFHCLLIHDLFHEGGAGGWVKGGGGGVQFLDINLPQNQSIFIHDRRGTAVQTSPRPLTLGRCQVLGSAEIIKGISYLHPPPSLNMLNPFV